jgi:hypothetical protein
MGRSRVDECTCRFICSEALISALPRLISRVRSSYEKLRQPLQNSHGSRQRARIHHRCWLHRLYKGILHSRCEPPYASAVDSDSRL